MEEQKVSGNYEELVHYGVLGMKWGIRRTPQQLGHKKPKKAGDKAKSDSDDKKFKRKLERLKKRMQRRIDSDKKNVKNDKRDSVQKKISKLSDEELKKRVNRLNLEKQYMDLVTPKAPEIARGKEIAYYPKLLEARFMIFVPLLAR